MEYPGTPLCISFVRGAITNRLGVCNRFFNRFCCSPLVLFDLVSFSLAPTYRLPVFFHVRSFFTSPSPFFFLRALSYGPSFVHTRAYFLEQTRLRCPRFATMRFGSSVAPFHMVPFSLATSCLSCLFHRSFVSFAFTFGPWNILWVLRHPPARPWLF